MNSGEVSHCGPYPQGPSLNGLPVDHCACRATSQPVDAQRMRVLSRSPCKATSEASPDRPAGQSLPLEHLESGTLTGAQGPCIMYPPMGLSTGLRTHLVLNKCLLSKCPCHPLVHLSNHLAHSLWVLLGLGMQDRVTCLSPLTSLQFGTHGSQWGQLSVQSAIGAGERPAGHRDWRKDIELDLEVNWTRPGLQHEGK